MQNSFLRFCGDPELLENELRRNFFKWVKLPVKNRKHSVLRINPMELLRGNGCDRGQYFRASGANPRWQKVIQFGVNVETKDVRRRGRADMMHGRIVFLGQKA